MTGPRTGGALLVDCLLAQGVDTAFGVPGESYLAVLDALHDVEDGWRYVPCRQEGGAAYMSEAWARFSGHGPPEMFIFAMFYKGFHYSKRIVRTICFIRIFEGARPQLHMQ